MRLAALAYGFLIGVIMASLVILGLPYVDRPRCETQEGIQAMKPGGVGCGFKYNYINQARFNLLKLIAGKEPVVFNVEINAVHRAPVWFAEIKITNGFMDNVKLVPKGTVDAGIEISNH